MFYFGHFWSCFCFLGLFFFLINLFIYFFFFAVLGLHFCARAFSSWGERGPLFIALRGPLTGTASLVAEHRLQTRRLSSCGSWASCSAACGIFPDQGSNPCPLHWQADSQPLRRQGSPAFFLNKFIYLFIYLLIYLFIFGCAGSSLLRELSLVAVIGGYSSLWCAGFSLRWLLLLWSTGSGTWASVATAHKLSSCGSWALECRLSGCGAQA